MLKRFFALLIALSIFLTLNTFADASNTLKTSQIVSKVSYSQHDKVFYLYTQKDALKRFWVIAIKPAKGETIAQLKKRVIGHTIDIYYVMVENEAEIIETVIR